MRNIEIANVLTHPLRQGSCFGRADPGEEDREFFAAATSDQLAAAARSPDEHAGNLAQTIVTGRMAVDIIETFETVHVEQQQ
jgi:hypothetical protein